MRSGDFMFVFQIIVVILLNSPFGKGRQIGGSKDIVKTIKVGDEDIIDCIDVHKQLALTHPLLINHTIQMKPSMYSKSEHETLELKQSWHKYGRCPQGSIPVSRKYTPYNSSNLQRKLSPFAGIQLHQYAMVQLKAEKAGTIFGAHGTLNVWNPVVNPSGLSISQLWIVAGADTNLNTIEAGWRVHPADGQKRPRLFIYWTRDNYKSTGCYDLNCPGFVQTNKDYVVGAYIDNSSVYDGIQREFTLNIQKDLKSRVWWLSYSGIALGYWPFALFTSMSENGGDIVAWGGEVSDSKDQMGSGHFSTEGFKRSCFIRGIKYTDNTYTEINPNQQDFQVLTTNPTCYDSRFDVYNSDLRLFFGGPGCQAP